MDQKHMGFTDQAEVFASLSDCYSNMHNPAFIHIRLAFFFLQCFVQYFII